MTDGPAARAGAGGRSPVVPRPRASSSASAASAPSTGRRSSVQERLDHGADRPERRRQDDLLQPDHGLLQARPAARRTSTATTIHGRPPYTIARLGMVRTFQITKALARDAGDRQHDARRAEPARREAAQRRLPPARVAPARAARSTSRRSSCSSVFNLDQARRRLRRHALGRPAQAARAGAGADGAAALPAPRRADGGDQPDAGPPPARPHAAPAPRGRASPSSSSSTTWRS